VVVNDATRPACALELLEPVAGALAGRCRVLVATGAHGDVDRETKDALLPEPLRDSPWCTNDRGSGPRVRMGRTSRGTLVEIHPWLAGGGPVLLTGSVEPHYFAGFTGGRKSVLPGCSSYRSIEDNHWLACMPGSGPAVLEGNPVHEDMEEAAGMLARTCPVTAACCVVRGGEIAAAATGGHREVFRACVAEASRLLCRPVGRAPSLLLRPGAGLESSLYQSMKAVYNWAGSVLPGGAVLLSSPCRDGLGAPHMHGLLTGSRPGDRMPARGSYRLGDHSAARLSAIRASVRLFLESELEDGLVRELGFTPVHGPFEREGALGPDVLTVDDAGLTAPLPEGRPC
jgi:nickel-dependent lactate racemase